MLKLEPAIKRCRACASPLVLVMDLGAQPPANALLTTQDQGEEYYPLRLCRCASCYLLQVDTDVAPKALFADTPYFSSYSTAWLDHSRRFCEMARERFKLDSSSFVVEIGSNDGYLLKNFKDIPHRGIEPSPGAAKVAKAQGISTQIAFFNSRLALPLADLIICNNVLGHVPDLKDFIHGLAKTIKPTGTITIEFPHALTLIQQCEFDTIYHEHFSYCSLKALEPLFARFGLHVQEVEELSTHGGSLRFYVGKVPRETIAVHHLREKESCLAYAGTYIDFETRARKIRTELGSFLNFYDVVGYGAAAKGNTFLNYCGISDEIPYVADITPAKQGKFLPGSRIPIVTEERLLTDRPPYVWILPWNHRAEIMERLKIIRSWGGQFLTAIPRIQCW